MRNFNAVTLTPTLKAKAPVFDPRDLRDVRSLCDDGLIPYHHKTAERFCKGRRDARAQSGHSLEDDGERGARVSVEALKRSL